ncbi:hypothetical protein C4577_05075 [Candidatus Parcubacteria bacterium]|nr:MAG: hypothetical protein C4577_05075 [Candidatus Parcubacteria bacterium]
MNVIKTERGFEVLEHPRYVEPHDKIRLAQQSSAIGDYNHSFENPGSSYLWIGEHHHLNKEEVQQFIEHLQNWLKTGKL